MSLAEHPKIQIALHNRAEPFDMAREGIDVAIHFGRKEWIDGALTELCPEDLVAVASPVMADVYEIKQPQDLYDMPLLHLRTRDSAWEIFFDSLGLSTDIARQEALFDQFATMVAAAIHGLGAAILPSYLIESELAQGTLVALGRPECPDDMYFVVTPRGVANPAASAFRNWATAEARASSRKRVLRQAGE